MRWARSGQPARNMTASANGRVIIMPHREWDIGRSGRRKHGHCISSLSNVAGGEESSILDSLPSSLADLSTFPGLAADLVKALVAAEQAITDATDAFPDTQRITTSLLAAAALLQEVDEAAAQDFRELHGHRIARKRAQVDAAILTALDLFERAYAEPAEIVPGGTSSLCGTRGEGG